MTLKHKGPECLSRMSGPKADYLKAKQAVQLLKAERDTLAKDLRPKHPKIIKLNDEISKQENLIGLFRADAVEKLATRRISIGKQMENLQSNVKEWETKALDLSQRLAQFNRLKGKVDRLKTLYDRLTNNLKEVGVSQVVDSGDQVSIMEMASAPISVRPGLIKSLLIGLACGALAGLAILLLLDRIDDRMASFGEFQQHFSENVLGQIPWEKTKGKVSLLQADDARHIFAESYRNIRSSIFFMPYEGPRPKTLLITSAVPNEGKSTISANLAITLALSGAKTLLIDGDLRRGAQREAFGLSSRIGFSEVLQGQSQLAGSSRAHRLSKPVRPAAWDHPFAAERAPPARHDRPAPPGTLPSLRLHRHRQLAHPGGGRYHQSRAQD